MITSLIVSPCHLFTSFFLVFAATSIHNDMRTPMRDRAWNPYALFFMTILIPCETHFGVLNQINVPKASLDCINFGVQIKSMPQML